MIQARRPNPSRHRGATLVELVIAIAIISVAVAGVLQVMTLTTQHSADPMVREQGQLIAEAYMEEILLKPFVDPNTLRVCTPATVGRTSFNKVCDYNGLIDNGAYDQFGNAIPAPLDGYTVTVTISPSPSNPADATVYLNAASPDPTGVWNDYGNNRIRVLRVDITVNGPGGTSVPLTGYRTDYDCNIATGGNCAAL